MNTFSSHNQRGKNINLPDEIILDSYKRTPFNVAIVGGGLVCHELLQLLTNNKISSTIIKIVGVADVNLKAPGLCFAKEKGIFTTDNYHDLFSIPNLDLVIELTGSQAIASALCESKPQHVSFMDHRGATLLIHLIKSEVDKLELERLHKESLEKERAHTQVILNSMPYRIMVVNRNFIVDTVNQTFLKEFGLTLDQVIGNPCYKVRYGLDRPCHEAGHICYLEKYFDEICKKHFFSTIKEFRDEKGQERFDVITIAPIFNQNGEITQFLEASRDVTDRIKLEREVRKSNTFFENVIQSTVDGIVVVDTKGNVLNRAGPHL